MDLKDHTGKNLMDLKDHTGKNLMDLKDNTGKNLMDLKDHTRGNNIIQGIIINSFKTQGAIGHLSLQ
jgi:signal transduction histidine kinase